MKGTMKAIAKLQAAPGLTLIDAPIPQPGPGEVLIKVHKTAICGTDLHIYNWDAWSRKNIVPPLIIGHEYVGEIAELGPNVDGLTVGERVSGEGHIVCHHCRNCRAGNGQWCKFTKGVGVNRDGAFAEYVCIPASNVIPINPEIDEDVVAFFDAFGNATHTALMFDVVGEDVLITGRGLHRHDGRRDLPPQRRAHRRGDRRERLSSGNGEEDGRDRGRQRRARED